MHALADTFIDADILCFPRPNSSSFIETYIGNFFRHTIESTKRECLEDVAFELVNLLTLLLVLMPGWGELGAKQNTRPVGVFAQNIRLRNVTNLTETSKRALRVFQKFPPGYPSQYYFLPHSFLYIAAVSVKKVTQFEHS